MRVTTTMGQRRAERLGQVGDVGADVAGRRVAGADLGVQAQQLGKAGIGGGRE